MNTASVKVLLAAVATVFAIDGYADAPDLLAPLTLGRYSVGFAEWEHEGLTVSACTFAETQEAQLRAALEAVSSRFATVNHKVAVVGHSFGARAGLLLAMTDRRIGALVSLDGGIGSAIGVEAMRSSPSFRTGRVPPVLHLYEREDAFMQPDLTLLQSVGAQALHTEQIAGLRHVHFTTTGFAAAAVPELGALTRAPDDVAARLAHVADRTLWFLKMYLREKRQ